MPRNKQRIQLALYARPKHPGSYHYALFVAPKSASGAVTKHHVKNTLMIDDTGEGIQPWRYERTVVSDVDEEQRLLVRVVVAKVAKSCDDVQLILESVPVYQVDDPDKTKAQSFSCRTWVRNALQELKRQGAVRTKLDEWDDVERNAREYINRKKEQRRWSGSWKGEPGVPLLDLVDGKEIIE